MASKRKKDSEDAKVSRNPDPRPEVEVDEPRIIKRYANRKLYDTRESRYVTLQQIASFVRDGEEVRIVDNRDQSDLTDVTLAQILYEEQKRGAEGRSIGALRGLIQRGGERLMTSLRPMGRLVRAEGSDDSSDSDPTGSRRFPVGELHRFADDRVRAVLASAMSHVSELQGEVRRLQDRVEVLEGQLRRLSGRRRRGDAPPKPSASSGPVSEE